MMQFEIDMTTKGASPLRFIPVEGFDGVSLEISMIKSTTFNTGVIEVKKANSINGGAFSFDTPKTISAPGFTDLSAGDYARAAFLVLEVTTAASVATVVLVRVHMTKIGFST